MSVLSKVDLITRKLEGAGVSPEDVAIFLKPGERREFIDALTQLVPRTIEPKIPDDIAKVAGFPTQKELADRQTVGFKRLVYRGYAVL